MRDPETQAEPATAPAAALAPYVPPYPPRPDKELSPLKLLAEARKNLLTIWPAQAFSMNFSGRVLFRRAVFICNSPITVRKVFIDTDNFHAKAPQLRHALVPLVGDGLFVSTGELWKNRRAQIAPLAHISQLPELSRSMTSAAQARGDAWEAKVGQEIDALAEMAEMGATVICSAVFGSGLGAKAARTVVKSFTEYQAAIDQFDIISLLGLPDFIPRRQNGRVQKAAKQLREIIDGLVRNILADPGGEGSLARAMAAGGMDRAGMDEAAICNEAAVLFMAGYETTATTMAWVWFILSQDPQTEARLHAEVDALGGRPATHADMADLPFTRAVAEETLRLYPPIPLQVREARSPQRISSHDVPAGAVMILVAWLLHRNPKYWKDPDAFIPDRFMPGAAPPERYSYVPFSIGPRVCLGAAFGITEVVLCIATLAQRYRLTLKPGWEVVPTCRLSLRPGDRLPMRVEARTR